MSAAPPHRRVAYLLADTPIPDDPRVRRVGDMLHEAGWRVTGIGMSGWRSPAPPWPILCPRSGEPMSSASPAGASAPSDGPPAPDPQLLLRPGSAMRENLKNVWRSAAWVGATALAPAAPVIGVMSPSAAAAFERGRRALRDDSGWPIRQFRRARSNAARLGLWAERSTKWARLYAGAYDAVEDDFLYRAMPHLRDVQAIAIAQETPGVWIANDWRMLPAAAAAADRVGGRVVYDSHEFATEEYAERLSWRLFQRPVAAAVERRWIRTAAAVVSVSPGITDALRRMYGLTVPTDTIRNTPVFQETPFRATGATIELLYHGVVSPGRGLEASIRAVALLRHAFRLSIRGPSGLPGYREHLEALIAEAGVADRVRLLPPVPMTELVTAASAFDIGLMALPGHSAHNRFALPNKIFEYMMAGLALCVSDLPAMADIVASSGAGVRMRDVTPEAIAEPLNRLAPHQIDKMKKAALSAAHMYNWQTEGGRFMELLNRISLKAH